MSNQPLKLKSKTVPDALTFLKTEKLYFEDIDATVEFMKYIKNAFDILNSGSKFSIKPFNRPVSFEIVNRYKDFVDKFTNL